MDENDLYWEGKPQENTFVEEYQKFNFGHYIFETPENSKQSTFWSSEEK